MGLITTTDIPRLAGTPISVANNGGASEHKGEQWADGGPLWRSQRVVVLYDLVNLAPGPIKRVWADFDVT